MFQTGFPPIIRSSKLHTQRQVFARPIPDAVCAVWSSWWWAENPSETYRASYGNKLWNIASCWFYSTNTKFELERGAKAEGPKTNRCKMGPWCVSFKSVCERAYGREILSKLCKFQTVGFIWDVKVLAAANVEVMSSVGGSRFLLSVGDHKSTRCHILEHCFSTFVRPRPGKFFFS